MATNYLNKYIWSVCLSNWYNVSNFKIQIKIEIQ